jgi:hypothetical protein
MLEYWNIGIMGNKKDAQKASLPLDPSFHHSNIPVFQTGNLTENMLAYPPLNML